MCIEIMKKIYGALKIEYRHYEGERYFVYGFKYDEKEWKFQSGELLLVTKVIKEIRELKKHFITILSGDVFCEECFKQKKMDQLKNTTKYWGRSVWDGLPNTVLKELQNQLLVSIPEFSWSNVVGLDYDEPFVFFGVCTSCLDKNEYNNSELFKEYNKKIDLLSHQFAAETIINGNEDIFEKYIADHVELIESGMSLIESQKKINGGIIDLLARDKDNKLCVIELKVTNDDKNIVWQAAYYQSAFHEDVRVITIAPNYSANIKDALENVPNTELKTYKLDQSGLLQINDLIEKEQCKANNNDNDNDESIEKNVS